MKMKNNMLICNCGRIHMLDMDKVKKIIEKNRYILIICSGCGRVAKIQDIGISSGSHNVSTTHFEGFHRCNNTEIALSNFVQNNTYACIGKIYYNNGIKVPMKSGSYAASYYDGVFSDVDFHLTQIQKDNITVEEIQEMINRYDHDKTVVDMFSFIHDNTDNDLDEISRHDISSFNWKGTKYEKNMNE